MAIPLKLNLKRWRSTDTAKCDCGLEHTTFLHQLGHTIFLHQQWGTQHFATTYGAQKEFASVGHDYTKIYSSEHKRHSRSSQFVWEERQRQALKHQNTHTLIIVSSLSFFLIKCSANQIISDVKGLVSASNSMGCLLGLQSYIIIPYDYETIKIVSKCHAFLDCFPFSLFRPLLRQSFASNER